MLKTGQVLDGRTPPRTLAAAGPCGHEWIGELPHEFVEVTGAAMDAEQIVRAVAAADPTDYDTGQCAFCNRLPGGVRPHPETATDHNPACPWRLASQWVAANPG